MLLEIYLIVASIFDIRNRTLPTVLMVIAYCFAVIGILYNWSLWCIIPVIVWLALTFINANRIKHNKKILIGGADIVCYLAIGCIYPNPIILIGVPAGAFLLSTFCRMIPKVNESFTKKGIPYIPFMGISEIILIIVIIFFFLI